MTMLPERELKSFRWTVRKERAAALVACDDQPEVAIADGLGVHWRTLRSWRRRPEFQARVADHVAALRAAATAVVHARFDQLATTPPLDHTVPIPGTHTPTLPTPAPQIPLASSGTDACERAAFLVAQGEQTNPQIAAVVGVRLRTLLRWKRCPAFQARVEERLAEAQVAARQLVLERGSRVLAAASGSVEPEAIAAHRPRRAPGKEDRQFRWTAKRELAALLLAQDTLSDSAIAAAVGIGRRTLYQWRARPAFLERVAAHAGAFHERARCCGLAQVDERVASLNERWRRLWQIIHRRAEAMAACELAVPGAATGLLIPARRPSRSGTEGGGYRVDGALLRELRAHEEQVAKELDRWEKARAASRPPGPIEIVYVNDWREDEPDAR